jgi:hypothetical protein
MRTKKSVLKEFRQISLNELALLEMTNDPKTKVGPTRVPSVMLTTKEAYIWATLIAHIAEREPAIRPKDLVRAATGVQIRKRIKQFYRYFPIAGYEGGLIPNVEIVPDPLQAVISQLHLNVNQNNLVHSAGQAYETLIRKGLIEDPIEMLVGGVLVAAMGMVPVSFTQKTKEGPSLSKKLKALYWSYERSEKRGITTTKVEFRLLKMIKAFKEGMVGGFKNALKDDGDQQS